MPTANNTSPRTAKAGAKAARKPAARRSAASARRRSTTRTTKYRTNGSPATVATRDGLGEYAERAVLIPVGAALIARDRVVSTVNGTLSSYSSSAKAQAQLRRFERRGVTARNRLERQVRKARVRVERELRQRRRRIEKTVQERSDVVAKNSTDLANRVPELASRAQERILSLV
jgi:hypothetical protein